MLRLRLVASLLCTACLSHGACTLSQERAAQPAAKSACPWLTTGSAAHALNGEVRVTVSLKDKSQGICTFSRLGADRSELKIFVGGTDLPSCPKDSATVAGIGTRAGMCFLHATRRDFRQMLSGAVREKAFAVVIAQEAGKSHGTLDAESGSLKQIAEMVAGSLF